ncbi:DUF3703 domain-containing protein [Noviherbaspirillum suwonense]|uniref:Membrane-associated phospholipid phosphatase n=1 Tax=Noviherbaspirillum suwonense TaxID=1224511 RepID=A0ABY1QVA4_9BURK|nr:DUF3703 domain-containing protein [Noviherbaspirillum suwonense]SMP81034.1 Membrane-associated phospholipid phosphatase [Noviherbaspirillum suwonense]
MTVKEVLYDWGGLNLSLFQAINHSVGKLLTPLAYAGSTAGSYWGMPLLLCVLVLLAHNRAQRGDFLVAAKLRLQGRRLIVGFLSAWLSAGILKVTFGFPRPLKVLGSEVRLISTPHDVYSLPSGHVVYTTLVAVVLWPLVKPRIRPLLLTFVVWVGWSRIAAGAHFPADVVAGGLIGILSGMIARQGVRPSAIGRNVTSIRSAFDGIIDQAKKAYAAGEWVQMRILLQDAHVLGQCLFWPHLLSHWWMLRLAYRCRAWRAIRGQILRLALVPIGHLMGRLPLGNTGDANVSAFRPMPIPIGLKEILEKQYDR